MHAVYRGNYREAYTYIAAQDKSIKTVDEYVQECQADPVFKVGLAMEAPDTLTPRVVSLDHDVAVLTVTRSAPDMTAILDRFADPASARTLTEQELKKMSAKEIRDKLQGKEVPRVTIHETYTLVKEDDRWRVFFDWKTQQAEQRKQETISRLLADASQLRRTHNFAEALKKYEEILAIDRNVQQAAAEKAEVLKELDQLQEKQQYLALLQLQNIRIERQRQRGSEALKDSVIGTIVNQGDRTLTRVKVAVYFLDAEGNEINYPALASEFSYISDTQLLTPRSKKDFGFTIEGYAPPDWSGRVSVKITDIEFAPPVHVPATPERPTVPTAVVPPAASALKKAPAVPITPTESMQPMPRYHVVKPMETLFSIAQRYGTTPDELYRLNNLPQNQSIKPGQRLIIAQ